MFRNNVWFSGSACLSPFVKGAAVKTTQHPKVPDGGAQHQTHVRVLQHLPLKLSAPLTNNQATITFPSPNPRLLTRLKIRLVVTYATCLMQ